MFTGFDLDVVDQVMYACGKGEMQRAREKERRHHPCLATAHTTRVDSVYDWSEHEVEKDKGPDDKAQDAEVSERYAPFDENDRDGRDDAGREAAHRVQQDEEDDVLHILTLAPTLKLFLFVLLSSRRWRLVVYVAVRSRRIHLICVCVCVLRARECGLALLRLLGQNGP